MVSMTPRPEGWSEAMVAYVQDGQLKVVTKDYDLGVGRVGAPEVLAGGLSGESLIVKVEKVNTRIMKDGKHAIIKMTEDFSAEEVGMRLGIF